MSTIKDLEYYLSQARRIAEHREREAELGIRKTYKTVLEDIRSFLGNEYAKKAKDDKLTYADLQQKGQFARFLEGVEKVVNEGTPEVSKQIKDTVNKVYEVCYNGMISAVKKAADSKELSDLLKGLKNTTPETVKRAVENPIAGLTLKDTLEKNRKEVIYNIKREISVGLANGDRYTTMAKRLTERVDMDYRKAVTIMRTETHRVKEAGFHDGAVDVNEALNKGVTDQRLQKIWTTMQDERVRKSSKANHRKMNGIRVSMEDKFDLGGGVTAECPGNSGSAANDIRCRCFLKYELAQIAEKIDTIRNRVAPYREGIETAREYREEAAKAREELDKVRNELFKHEADRWKAERIEEKVRRNESLKRQIADSRMSESEYKALEKRIEELKQKEKELEDLYNKWYDGRPPREKEEELKAWREWRKTVDVGELEDQLEAAFEERKKLQKKLTLSKSMPDLEYVSDEDMKFLKKYNSFNVAEKEARKAELIAKAKEASENADKEINKAVMGAGKEVKAQIKKEAEAIEKETKAKLKEYEKKAQDLTAKADELGKKLVSLTNDYRAEINKAHEYMQKGELDKYREYMEKADAIKKKSNDVLQERKAITAENTKVIEESSKVYDEENKKKAELNKKVLRDIRQCGTDKDLSKYILENDASSEDDKRMTAAVRGALKDYPAEWVESSLQKGTLTTGKVDRGYYNNSKDELMISGRDDHGIERTSYHELGHRMEYVNENVWAAEKAFYDRRTEGEKLEKLSDVTGRNFEDWEVTKKDNFINAYIGKDYNGTAYEVVSMGFERYFVDPQELEADPDYEEFIMGVLAIC